MVRGSEGNAHSMLELGVSFRNFLHIFVDGQTGRESLMRISREEVSKKE